MGTGLFIIDVVIITIVILPFVLFINGRKKRQRKLRNALESEAARHNYDLGKIETHSNFAIGLDTAEEKLFFYKETEDKAYAQIVDLKAIVSCKSIKEYKQANSKSNPNNVVEKIQLSFVHQNPNDVTNVVLYDNDDEMTLNNELSVAQKWQDYISEILEANTDVMALKNTTHIATA